MSTKFTKSRGVTVGVTPGPHTVGGLTLTANRTMEQGEVIEKIRYDSTIVDHHRDGVVWWRFDVDDDNFQKFGIIMEIDVLPSVSFEFVGRKTLPESMDMMIASHWSMIRPKDGSSWIAKLFNLFKSFGDDRPAK